MSPRPRPRNIRSAALLAVICAVTALAAGMSTSVAAPVPAPRVPRAAVANPTNPLAGRPWGVYKGDAEQAWPPYRDSTGTTHKLLAKIALQPKAKWFGKWLSDSEITQKVKDYIANATGGDPSVLVPMTIFRMVPWEQDALHRLPTAAEKASYKRWINRFAAAVGNTYAAIVLQPDGPFANEAPHHSNVLHRLIAYAAKRLSAQPHTTVYIEAGSGDWTRGKIGPALELLTKGGIQYVRGFALNGTHYDSTAAEIAFGTRIVKALAARGYPGKHFVVDTAENGRPFTGKWWHAHPSGMPGEPEDFNNAVVCQTKSQTHCVTLGIPPTVHVAESRWHLPLAARQKAAKYVDAYMWFGRPWLKMQTDPFLMERALPMCRTTPFQ
jgi:endoglucanase